MTITTRGPEGERVQITNAPPELKDNPEELKRLVLQALDNGQTSIDYAAQAQGTLAPQSQQPTPTPQPQAQPGINPTFAQAVDAQRYQAQAGAPDPRTGQQPQDGETNAIGATGAVTRGLGPYAAGAATGAAVGSTLGGVGAIPGAAAGLAATGLAQVATPIITNMANRILGTNWETPQKAWTALFDRLGVEKPDSKAEEFIEQASNDVGMALSTIGLGQALQTGAAPLQQTTAQGVGRTLAADPASQVTGAVGGAAGAAGAREVAENRDMGPGASAALQMGGAIAGDMLASRPLMRTPGQQQTARRRLEQANLSPEDARAAVRAGEEAGVPVYRSDIMPPDTPGSRAVQDFRENVLGGMGKPRTEQQLLRNRAIVNELSEYDVVPGGSSALITDELAQGFIKPRRTALNRYTTQKREALAAVPPNEPVDVDNTIKYLNDQIEELTRRGSYNADVNISQTPGASAEVDAAQQNIYQPLIRKLSQYRAAFQNKDINDLEALRREFGESFVPQGGMATVPQSEQKIINKVYRSIRSDIGEAVRRNGGDDAYEKWADANENLSNLQADFNNEALKSLLKRADEAGTTMVEANPEVIRRVVTSEDPEIVRQVFERLDSNGRDRAAGAIMQDIMERSTPDIRNLSPDKFADNLHNTLQRRGVVMTPEQNQRLNGLEVLLDRTRRAERAATSRPDDPGRALNVFPGARYSLARILANSPFIGASVGIGSMGIAGAISRHYDSPAVRDKLLDLATAADVPSRADEIARELVRTLTTLETGRSQAEQAQPTQRSTWRATQQPISPTMQATVWQ